MIEDDALQFVLSFLAFDYSHVTSGEPFLEPTFSCFFLEGLNLLMHLYNVSALYPHLTLINDEFFC